MPEVPFVPLVPSVPDVPDVPEEPLDPEVPDVPDVPASPVTTKHNVTSSSSEKGDAVEPAELETSNVHQPPLSVASDILNNKNWVASPLFAILM